MKFFLFILTAIFVFFTFYGLNWGAPFYFHPDERNIASAVTQIKFPEDLNPNFFAYGTLPIYIIYLLGGAGSVPFEKAIILSRILSALLTLGSVFLIYRVANVVSGKKAALLAAVFLMTSVAYLQFSHFGTFEIWLSFFSLLAAYFFLLYSKTKKKGYFGAGTATLGLLCALKLSSAVLLLIPAFLILQDLFSSKRTKKKIINAIKLTFIFIYLFIAAYIVSSPFNILDVNAFLASMKYEREVALGTLQVFYTGAFYDKIPIFFQYKHVLPFLINPFTTAISIVSIFYNFYIWFKKRSVLLAIILLFFLTHFISSSVMFVKWTRYIVPAIPFLFILVAIFLERVLHKFNDKRFLLVVILITLLNSIFAFSYIKTVRFDGDTRVEATDFARTNIPSSAMVLSEVYDLGIITFNPYYPNITLFNFYDLENDPTKRTELPMALATSEYIILPSQRIYKSRFLDPKHFPNGNRFYSDLFAGNLGFRKIYETPCDIFCKITYLGDPVFSLEETSNVFDRPTIYIFKK